MQTLFNLQVEVESQWVEIFSEGSFLFIYEFSPENIHIITYLKQENYKKKLVKTKAMKSSPLLRQLCGSEFWGFSLLKI